MSHLADEQLMSLGEDSHRLDDAWRGVEWALATEADDYEVVFEPNLRQLPTDAQGGLPELNILYRIEEDVRVVVEHIETRDDCQFEVIFGDA